MTLKKTQKVIALNLWQQDNRVLRSDLENHNFATRISYYLDKLNLAIMELEEANQSLLHFYHLIPSECESIAQSLQKLHELICNLINIFESHVQTPPLLFPYRDEMLIPLNHLKTQICLLKSLVLEFRIVCKAFSSQTIAQKQLLFVKLKMALKSSQEIILRGETFIMKFNNLNNQL